MRLDVLVMEVRPFPAAWLISHPNDYCETQNLFYERQLTQVFDLKGSTRNRHVQVSPDRPNEVLMDENLVQSKPLLSDALVSLRLTTVAAVSYKNPLLVREASKRFIRTAIHNDSLFLSNVSKESCSLI